MFYSGLGRQFVGRWTYKHAGVEIAGVWQSEDYQKFGRTTKDGVDGSPTDNRKIMEYFNPIFI